MAEPGAFRTFPCPGYGEIRLVGNPWRLARVLDDEMPDAIHIATEGPLGLAARATLTRRGIAFTTSLHTKFPEYVSQRLPVPLSWGYAYLRWFHQAATPTLVTTESHRRELAAWGLNDLVVWGRGVDAAFFRPMPRGTRSKPRLLYVGRIAPEKNIEAFLCLDLDAEKIVVGDGPLRAELERKYPTARWFGYRRGFRPGAVLRGRRRVRLPVAHRHVRTCDARSDGLRHPRGRLPRDRAHRRCHAGHGRIGRGFAHGSQGGAPR